MIRFNRRRKFCFKKGEVIDMEDTVCKFIHIFMGKGRQSLFPVCRKNTEVTIVITDYADQKR